MAESGVQDLRTMLGGIPEVSDDRLGYVLASAKRMVKAQGVQVRHESFADLQNLYAAHMLESFGDIQGQVSGRSVGDVSASFASGGKPKSYFELYRSLLVSVRGMGGRIA